MVLIMTNHFSGEQAATSESECPRCGSRNTKFCYYNNYNKSQPRHFCKSCKRHWTKGGTLRNIPAGRRRRNKRPRASTTPEPPHKHSRSSLAHHHKDMSDILYQALIRSSSPPQSTILESNGTTSAFNAAAAPQIQNYTKLALSSFTSAPTSDETFDSPEESNSAAPAELWNWNEVDFLASLWDHSDAEPYNYKPIFEGYYPR